jgi:putative zinc finger protein
MTRCLDEATLQTYFDGELSGEMMERATLHLASCETCAAAAREIEEEINLMMSALAPEFETSVPTERLRQRLDAVVLDLRLDAASSSERTGFGAFISSLLSFGTRAPLGYASLAIVLAFAAIFAYVKLRTTTPPPVSGTVAETQQVKRGDAQVAVVPSKVDPVQATGTVEGNITNRRSDRNRDLTSRAARSTAKLNPTPTPASEPVKLLPGERAYLQTIARLDSTINANKNSMRPSLQVEYERNLAVVDRAIAATRTAAKSNPNDPDAADFMFAAYQSKVDLLNTIADARVGGGRSH